MYTFSNKMMHTETLKMLFIRLLLLIVGLFKENSFLLKFLFKCSVFLKLKVKVVNPSKLYYVVISSLCSLSSSVNKWFYYNMNLFNYYVGLLVPEILQPFTTRLFTRYRLLLSFLQIKYWRVHIYYMKPNSFQPH